MWKREEKKLLGRRRPRGYNNIKMDVKAIGLENVDWTTRIFSRSRNKCTDLVKSNFNFLKPSVNFTYYQV
jgi:hypothetical protein